MAFTVRKAVIPAAGLGTRLLPATKEMPKEMLPIFVRCGDGRIRLKPMLQAIFEQLYDFGFREFCFVVGRGKRAIEDHFTPDREFLNFLREKRKDDAVNDLEAFYEKINSSSIVFINQPEPRGFGDAILKAKPFVKEPFLVHAGDTYIISRNLSHLVRLMRHYEGLKAKATLLIQEVEDPRQYGVVEGVEVEEGVYRVKRVVEKPEKPPSRLAIMPLYVFAETIFDALEVTPTGVGGEVQLTDGIQKLIDWGFNVVAVKLAAEDIRLDIGSPKTCWDALRLSYKAFGGEEQYE